MAAFFLIALLVGSGSFFGMKVARAHRGEPWVATERFKSNMSLIGPYGVDAVVTKASQVPGGPVEVRPRSAPPSRSASRRSRPAPGVLSTETLQFILALLVAASAFTFVCASLGMLAWEFCLGTVAGTGLFVAFLLESRQARPRTAVNVAHISDWRHLPDPEGDVGVERSFAGSFG